MTSVDERSVLKTLKHIEHDTSILKQGASWNQKGINSEPKGDQNALKIPPTFWSGVLEHLEAKGGGFLLPTPLRPGRLAGHPQNISPLGPNGPRLDPFGQNGS